MMPAHSSEGYKLAAKQGADFIECDLAVTKDWPQNLTYYKKGQPDRDSEKKRISQSRWLKDLTFWILDNL